MRKFILFAYLLVSCCLLGNAQINDSIAWRKVDSVNKILKTITGKKLVDCYNLLAECYLFIWDDNDKHLDTACMYANMAIEEAKKTNYAASIGYAKATLAWRTVAKIDDNKNNNATEPAYIETYKLMKEVLTLADQLKDDYLAGRVYSNLVWVEKWKGTHDKLKVNTEKAIQYFEKLSGDEFKNSYHPLGLVNCAGCKGTEAALAHLYGDLAGIYIYENNPLAKDQLELASRYYTTLGNKFALGYVYLELAQSYFLKYDYKTAEWALTTSKNIFHEAGNIEMELQALAELNKVYEVRGDFENGIATSKNSIKLIEEYFKNNPSGSLRGAFGGWAFFWMSRLYNIAGDYEGSLAVIRRGRQYYSDGNDSAARAPWLSEIGDTHRLLGNYDSAWYYLKSFQNSDNHRNNFGKTSLGYLYLDMKEYAKAQSLILPYYQSLKASNRVTNPIVNALNIVGNASLGEKKYEQALEYAKEAQDYLKQMDGRVQMIDNYKLLSAIYDKMNKPDSAYAYLKLYTSLKDSLINRQFYFKLNNLKNESEEQKKTSQINLLNKDNQLKEQKLKQQAFVKNSLITGLILILLLGVFIFRTLTLKRKSELQKQRLENEKKQAELQQRSTELEMQALRAQMNPHFIFNCLSSINKFILKNDTDAASDYLTRFSRLIRLGLTNSQLSLIPLSDEIEMLRLYLDMERLRFSETFNYNIIYENNIEPETIYIPPMLLQPFCENAIWHGLMHKEGQGRLDIMMSIQNGELQCIMADNGIGREKAAELKSKTGTKQKSFGLKITTERLALFNNEKAVHSFYRTEDVLDEDGNVAGTKVILTIKFKNTTPRPVKELI